MNTFKIILKSRSSITQLPDSQTIFGTICNIIKQTQGEDKLLEFFNSFENIPLIINSSMFLDGLFPMFHKNVFNNSFIHKMINSNDADKQIEMLNDFKKFKKIKWITKEVFENYVLNDNFDMIQNDLLENILAVENDIIYFKNTNIKKLEYNRELLTKVKTDKLNYLDGENRDLYYDPSIRYSDNQLFNIFIKSSLDTKELENIFKYFSYFPLGNRKSTGKNIFEFKSIQEINYKKQQSKYVYLLSKCITDDEFILEQSNYQITHKFMRTSNNYLNNELYGDFNMFSEGSLMTAEMNKEYYGKVFPITVNDKTIYYYGIGFVF